MAAYGTCVRRNSQFRKHAPYSGNGLTVCASACVIRPPDRVTQLPMLVLTAACQRASHVSFRDRHRPGRRPGRDELPDTAGLLRPGHFGLRCRLRCSGRPAVAVVRPARDEPFRSSAMFYPTFYWIGCKPARCLHLPAPHLP